MVNVEIDARILEDKKFNTQVENILPRGQRDVVANIVFEAARRVVFLNQQERARKAAEKANEKAAGNDI